MAGFKARARALDMLGRQQISGIPTAISELFKNAYDAYADNVVLDFFRQENLVVLRDDGFGMTKDDFESKWLTIGTESKVDSQFGNRKTIDIPEGKAPRAIMGEKGIGRLAIAMIGSQVLIVTRAKRNNALHHYVVSFINWRLFEQPGLNLEDIQIPIKELPSPPSQQDLVDIIHESKQNTQSLKRKIEPHALSVILDELTRFSELQFTRQERKLTAPCQLNDEYCGTRFYIYPASDMLPKSLESNGIDQDAPDITKMLIGFTDSVFTNHKNIPLKTHFRDHKYPETYDDIIADTNFFSESEIEQCDHFFHGSFDANGQFTAKKIRIFGTEQPEPYSIPWLKNNGRPTQCGSFELIVAEIQGNASESALTREIHSKLFDKLYLFGGLYVYKDGIRILPYGNNHHDFLNIEYRRSKHAGKHHWSYRRLIGAVRLTTGINDALKEKAGREGFQSNAAFVEMREILMNFFIQTASDFFNEDGSYADYYLKAKNDNVQRDALLKKEAEKQKTKRVKFTNELYAVTKALDNNQLETECANILAELKHQLSSIDETQNKEHAATLLIDIEKQANTALANIKSTFALSKPRGISTQKKDEALFQYYKSAVIERINPTLDATQRQIVDITNEKMRLAKLEINRRLRIESTLSQASKKARKQIETQVTTTDNLLSKVQESVHQSTASHAKAIRKVIRDNEFLLGQTNFQHMSEEEIYDWRINVENNLISTLENGKQELEIIQTLLDNVKWVKEDNGKVSSYIDVLEANDSKLQELIEKSDLDTDLAQLGMAIHIINHEFDASIRMVRDNLRRLKAWADVNDGLSNIYSGIKHSFDHLDSYLNLFTPLNRRMYRNRVDIIGHEIESFIFKLFGERLARHHITLKSTKAFREYRMHTFPSSIYPVFVNIIDNASYWIKGRASDGVIELDADESGIIISNNGPKIPDFDQEAIFEMGFSRKSSGRGLGLAISQSVLKEQDMHIELIPAKPEFNVSFKIAKERDEK